MHRPPLPSTAHTGRWLLTDAVDANTIYQQYSLQVDGSNQELNFSATMRVGGATGTTLELNDPARVEFDGRNTTQEQALGTRYKISYAIDPSEALTFDVLYVDADSREFKNQLEVNPFQVVSAPVEIDRSQSLSIRLEGEAFVDRESVSLIIKAPGADAIISVKTPEEGKTSFEFQIPSVDLQRLPLNEVASIEIKRSFFQELDQVTSEGGASLNDFILRFEGIQITD